jgi:hypothetical protein
VDQNEVKSTDIINHSFRIGVSYEMDSYVQQFMIHVSVHEINAAYRSWRYQGHSGTEQLKKLADFPSYMRIKVTSN